ncbi:hypothetical protein IC614_07975 [Allosphingosinicella flava]|uniref:Peptidase S1 domain-containing protein n=1 Tax=Allosphingosinicella flava TaxID=2771430 RepID=A0A7T2GI43_9SPHN|nr:hypothetical protein [Sphingosinicella flava]QPQ54297.1 hypothetical protein IC614_07975 [Sphingosinicella flava]
MPPSPSETTTAKVDPMQVRATTLKDAFGLDIQEANRRAALESAVWDAITRIAEAFPESFSGLAVSHVPNYEVKVYVSKDIAPPDILSLVNPSLRSVVKIKRVALNRPERNALVNEAATALRRQGISFSVSYDLDGDGLDVGLANPSDAAKARASLPDQAQRNLRFSKGGSHKQKAYTRPTGVLASDQTYGGWELYRSKSGVVKGICSIGFTGRDSYGDTIAITAGHCLTDPYAQQQTYTSNRHLTLPVEGYRSGGSDSALDVGHLNMQGVAASGGWVWTKNNVEPYEREYALVGVRTGAYQAGLVNTVSNFSGGYLKLAGVKPQSAQGEGLSICKYGVMTGLTCSVILNDYYSDANVTGFIETYYSPQWYLVGAGDSGGPVFTTPDANSTIWALGLVSGGLDLNHPNATVECKRDPANFCTMTYMPADRIDDFAPAQLFIYPSGTVYPGGY